MVRVQTTQTLGSVVRGQRRRKGMTQAALAKAAYVSRAWVGELEAGKPTIELGRVLAVLDALGIVMDLRPEEPQSRQSGTSDLDLDTVLERYRRGDDGDA